MHCRRYWVTGRVQGVWFRAGTQQQAESLGLAGYAANLPDGRVEVLACGPESSLSELEAWLWEGTPHAEVSDVTTGDAKGMTPPDTFETR